TDRGALPVGGPPARETRGLGVRVHEDRSGPNRPGAFPAADAGLPAPGVAGACAARDAPAARAAPGPHREPAAPLVHHPVVHVRDDRGPRLSDRAAARGTAPSRVAAID